jgi:hypothetical protein
MSYDRYKNIIYIHSARNLYKCVIENEDRDVWKAHLEKGDYEAAYDHCKSKELPFGKTVAKIYANHLFDRGQYINAAVRYADSDEKFEDVALKFLVCSEFKALKSKLLIIFSLFGNYR